MNKNWHLILILMIVVLLPAAAQDYGTGLKEVPDKLQQSFAQAQPAGLVTSDGAAPGDGSGEAETLPGRVDLSEYLPPVASQGRIGSCAAWSTIYYARTLLENKERGWGADDQDEIFAPLFTYNQITGGVNEGTYMGDHFEIAVNTGTATWQTFPDNHDLTARPDSRSTNEAASFRAESWKSLSKYNRETRTWTNNINDVKMLLAQGLPVVAGFATYNNLYGYRGGVYNRTEGSFLGGHAMCIVGYDDSRRVLKIVNSWGTDWGDEGFLWLSYDVWDEIANRGCVVLYDEVENTPRQEAVYPPSSLNATKGVSSESITLTWNPVEGTRQYILYRADNSAMELTELAKLTSTEYTDGDIPGGVHYVYAVKSENSAGKTSEFSPIAEGWTLEPVIEEPEEEPVIEEEPEEDPVITEEPKEEPVPQAEPGRPGIPGDIRVHVNTRYLILNWNTLENAEGYNIYKWNDSREDWLRYATSRDNKLVIRNVYSLYREGGGYFIVAGVNEQGEGFASDSVYINFRSKHRASRSWKRIADTAPADDTIQVRSGQTAFQGNFYRTDYFDYEYTMQQFRDFYEAEQRAFREYLEREESSFNDYRQQESDAFSSWRNRE